MPPGWQKTSCVGVGEGSPRPQASSPSPQPRPAPAAEEGAREKESGVFIGPLPPPDDEDDVPR